MTKPIEWNDPVDLATRYMGLQLKNPLVASASPQTGDLDYLRTLEESGVAAIVLPSLFEEEIDTEMRQDRSIAVTDRSQEALSCFPDSHALRSKEYLELIEHAVAAVDIPIIGSLNGTTDEGWTSYAKLIEEAGASGLELNVYFIPTDISMSGREVEQRYVDILGQVRQAVTIPVAIKIGPYFSSMGQIAMDFVTAGADALVLFNRFYEPDIDLGHLRLQNELQLSRANEIRLPLLWIAVLAGRIDASLAATTGVENAEEVIKYLLAGADVVMTTSALLRNGPQHIQTLLSGIKCWLKARDFNSVDQIRGLLSQRRYGNPDSFGRANYLKILRRYETLG